jgi:hypothetical protein
MTKPCLAREDLVERRRPNVGHPYVTEGRAMPSNADRPAAASAKVQMLFNGYVDTGGSPFSVASSIAFVRDGDVRVIIDPGMVTSPRPSSIPSSNWASRLPRSQTSSSRITTRTTRCMRLSSRTPGSTTSGQSTRTTRGPAVRRRASSSLHRSDSSRRRVTPRKTSPRWWQPLAA